MFRISAGSDSGPDVCIMFCSGSLKLLAEAARTHEQLQHERNQQSLSLSVCFVLARDSPPPAPEILTRERQILFHRGPHSSKTCFAIFHTPATKKLKSKITILANEIAEK